MTTTTEKENNHYVGENTRWFIDYLPKGVFDSLTSGQRKHYREYTIKRLFIGYS